MSFLGNLAEQPVTQEGRHFKRLGIPTRRLRIRVFFPDKSH